MNVPEISKFVRITAFKCSKNHDNLLNFKRQIVLNVALTI
jgi:hypothetical protein